MPPQQQRRGGRVTHPLLRVATHNVHGLVSHMAALVEVWMQLQLDVVLVQETWVSFWVRAQVEAQLTAACQQVAPSHPGFVVHWGHNLVGNANRSAGVAVLVRRSLCQAGQVVVGEQHIIATQQGRFMAVPVQWGGHSMTLVAAHAPNDSGQQQAFIQQHMQPHMPPGRSYVVGGDFNFVVDRALDEVTTAQHRGPAQPPAARVWGETLPWLVDAFRAAHPTRRAFTHHTATSARRLDRLYVTGDLQLYVQACFVADATPSDHRPVVLQLCARRAASQGRGLPRARVQRIWEVPAVRQVLEQRLQEMAQEAPQDQQALLDWWPIFKRRCLVLCMQLGREARTHSLGVGMQQRQAAQAQLVAAFDAVERGVQPAQLPAALQQVLQAREHWRGQVAAQAQSAEWSRRREWVHGGERPNPVLTSQVRPRAPREQQHVPAVRAPATGLLAAGGRALAQVVAEYWASVSCEPPVAAAARDEVLAAVQAAGLRLDGDVAAAVGACVVSEEEVKVAVKHSAPGKAPGMDGLPVELYRRYMALFVPLLARVYTAVGQLGVLPFGFTTGVIVCFHKSGPRASLANYRPITLLNTDYRVLAKILARRLRPVQGALISPEQTAFLPGRNIGENVMLLQCMPHALPPSSTAVCVFLDFRKAYDTISRPFLYQLLAQAGLGGGFLAWVQLLLHDTRSCACVNGYVSERVGFAAGVRQGCPLAPQLYLFVAQAMLCLLKHKGIGVTVGGRRVTATQFADDAQVFLESPAQIPALLGVLATFEQASGQGLNRSKTRVVLFGQGARQQYWRFVHTQWFLPWLQQQNIAAAERTPPASPGRQGGQGARGARERALRLQVRRDARHRLHRGASPATQMQGALHDLAREWQQQQRHRALSMARVSTWVDEAVRAQLHDDPCSMPADAEAGGLPLVGSAQALGVVFMATGQAIVDWQALVGQVAQRYACIARLPLSMFGRAFAASGYGLSKLLYAAEFVDVPPESVLTQLQGLTAKLVDRGLAPEAPGHHFAGVAAPALVGHPKLGGCGVMCLEQHIRARHARWAVRLMTEPDSVPWVFVARRVLLPTVLAAGPSWQHLGLPACNAATSAEPHAIVHAAGKGFLPPPLQRLVRALQGLPAWRDVSAAPLPLGDWCYNTPLWCNPFLAGQAGAPLPWQGLEARFGPLAWLGTINTVGDALRAHHEVHSVASSQDYQTRVRPFWFGASPLFAGWQAASDQLSQLVAALPVAWRQVAAQTTDAALLRTPTPPQVFARLLGRLGWQGPGSKQYALQAMTVRLFTALQWPEARAPVQARHAAFVAAVSATLPQGAAPVSQPELLAHMQAVWRLRWDNRYKEVVWRLVFDALPTAQRMHRGDRPCACGVAAPGWQHHFWECPVAQAVVAAMQAQLPPGVPALQPAHLWVGRMPSAALHEGVWRVAVVAGLVGMDRGRRLLAKWALEQREGAVVPQHLATQVQRVQVAARLAVVGLWDVLQDFVSLRLYPQAWLVGVGGGDRVGPAHPFLASRQATQGDPELCLRRV